MTCDRRQYLCHIHAPGSRGGFSQGGKKIHHPEPCGCDASFFWLPNHLTGLLRASVHVAVSSSCVLQMRLPKR